MKKWKAVIGIGLIIVMLLFVVVSYNSPPKVGCERGDEYIVAKFNRNCIQPESGGYFRIPKAQIAHCDIIDNKSFLARHRSTGPALKFTLFVSEILADAPRDDKVVLVHIAAGEESSLSESCAEYEDYYSSWTQFFRAKAKTGWFYDEIISYGDNRYKISGFRYDDPQSAKHEVYLKTDRDGNVVYRIFCANAADTCSLARIPTLGGRYFYGAQIPREFSERFFVIVEAIPKFLDRIYFQDSTPAGDK